MNNVTSYTNFLYIFPAAIWVNTVAPQFAISTDLIQLSIYILIFLFIPAELVSSSMWQRVSILRPNNLPTGDFQEGLLGFIDIFRILSLTVVYSTITPALISAPSIRTIETLGFSLGLFLILNFFWNKVEMPADASVFRLMREKLSDQLKGATSNRESIGIKFGIQSFELFNFLHNSFLAVIFPFIGAGLITVTLSGLVGLSVGNFESGGSFMIVSKVLLLAIFFLQVSFKSFQVVALSYVASFMETFSPETIRPSANLVRVVEVDIRSMEATTSLRTKLREIAEFRFEAYTADRDRHYPGLLFLSKDDQWDEQSVHIVAVDRGKTVGVARLSFVRDGLLPVSEESAFNRPLREGEYEMCRFVIHPAWRRTHAVVALFAGIIAELRQRGDVINIYADILVGNPHIFSRRRFEAMGFKSMNVNYLDRRYGCRSEILKLVEEDFDQFCNYIDKLSNFSRRHGVPSEG